MKEILIAFDIDGTLISNTNGLGKERLNVDVYNLMVLLSKMKNTKVIVWSGGGKEYPIAYMNFCDKTIEE